MAPLALRYGPSVDICEQGKKMLQKKLWQMLDESSQYNKQTVIMYS